MSDMRPNQARPEDMALAIGAKKLHEGRQFMYDQAKLYHDKFKDNKTGLFRDEFLEKRNCPVCNKGNYRKLFNCDGGIYVKCTDCEMCYLNPVFTDAALHKFYTGNNTVQSEVVTNENDFYLNIYSMGLNAIMKHTHVASILDVGCSAGAFLDLAQKKGWQTSGIELNQREFQMAVKKGHTVYDSPIESIKTDKKFNAISMWDVFEHIKDGATHLKTLKNFLLPGGVVFLQIPNFKALAARVLQEKCKMFDGLEHVNLYSPETISKIAEISGFQILQMETVISEIPIIANYLGYEDPYLGEVKHNSKILDIIDEGALHRNLLGYKLQVVLRKA